MIMVNCSLLLRSVFLTPLVESVVFSYCLLLCLYITCSYCRYHLKIAILKWLDLHFVELILHYNSTM